MINRPHHIPFSIVRELRCRNCQNVVSCGPVHVIPDESVLCGRCHDFAKDIYRNTSFEALASMFLYPCQHWEDHCPRILQWDESISHEEGCSYSSGCDLFWKHPKAFVKGKREMPYGDIRLVPIPERLLDYIKCVHCESYLTCEPVYIRVDGRNICHRCIHSNGVPLDCVRNVAYETLSSIIVFPCVFRNRGCPTRLKFGTDLWHHEAECSYNQMFRKHQQPKEPKDPKQKEKGVIKTHSGHIYGTLTPNAAPFSPPSPNTDSEINKQLVKSLMKKQERKLPRAEEIGSNISRMGSEDSCSDKDSDKANSIDQNRSSESTTPTTPDRLDDPMYKQHHRPEKLDFQTANLQPPEQQGYRQSSPVFMNSPKDFLHFNYNLKQFNENNYYQNIHMAQVHQDNDASLIPTPTQPYYDDSYDNVKRVSRNNSYNQNGYYDPSRSPAVLKTPLQELEYNPLEGQSPIYVNPYGQGLIPKPSFKGVVRTDSLSSNRELINELRAKQKQKKSSSNKEADNPYKECNSLEQILQVHDQFNEGGYF